MTTLVRGAVVVVGPGDVAARWSRSTGELGEPGEGGAVVLAVDPSARRLPDAALELAIRTVLSDGPRVGELDLVLVFAEEFARAWTRRLVTRVADPLLRVRPRDSTDMETSESIRFTLDALGQGTPGAVVVVASGWDAGLADELTAGLGAALVVRYRTWGEDPRDTDVEVTLRTSPADAAARVPVALSGLGVVTAYGSGSAPLVDGLTAGRDPLPDLASTSVIRPIAGSGGPPDWLVDALGQALGEAGWTDPTPPRLVLGAQATGSGETDPDNPIWAARHVQVGPWTWDEPVVVSHACASALFALSVAFRLVASGAEPAVLVAGVSACAPCMVDSLGAVRALGTSPSRPFDVDRDGITIGEGAGAVLVESLAAARLRGVEPGVELASVVASVRGRSAAASDSDAVAATMTAAVAASGTDRVDYVHAHATGTPQGDAAELEALASLDLGPSPVPVSSHKGALGHLLHASAFPGLAVGVQAIRTGVVPGTVNLRTPAPHTAVALPVGGARSWTPSPVRSVLVNAFGFGGNNAAVVLRSPGRRATPPSVREEAPA